MLGYEFSARIASNYTYLMTEMKKMSDLFDISCLFMIRTVC